MVNRKKINNIKSYGDNDYKGFVFLQNRKTKEVSKHYITHVSKSYGSLNAVNISVAGKGGDIYIENYKMGKSKKIDTGIKTWVKNRDKKKMRYDYHLPDSCYDFL